jgi:hypothetical protein
MPITQEAFIEIILSEITEKADQSLYITYKL